MVVAAALGMACLKEKVEQPAAVLPATTVSTAAAVAASTDEWVDASGSFVADEVADVAAQTSGAVVATPASVGRFVPSGAVLVRLDDRDARLRLAQVEAAEQQAENESNATRTAAETADSGATLAKGNLARYTELLKTGDVARTTYEQALQQAVVAEDQARMARQRLESSRAGVAGARAQAALLKKALDDTHIRAPFAGYVSERAAAIGEYVAPGHIVARILKTSPILLQALIPEADGSRIRPDAEATARVVAYPERTFAGRVRVVSPAVDHTARTMTAYIVFQNADNALRPGMFGTARVVQAAGPGAVVVPRAAALSDSPGNTRVFVVAGGIVNARPVRLGATDGDLVRVISGLQAGEVVATSNLARLRDGMKVNAEAR